MITFRHALQDTLLNIALLPILLLIAAAMGAGK